MTNPQAPSSALPRTLRLPDLTLIVVGTVIGSGIFIVPAVVLRHTGGSMGIALLIWLIAGLLSLMGALTYGELGASEPEAGGLYAYVRDAFGPLPAFLYGWTLFFVISSGSTAALAVAFTSYLGALIPLNVVGVKLVPVLMIGTVAGVNILGTRKGASLQNWTTLFKAGVIILMGVALVAGGSGDGFLPGTAPGAPDPAAPAESLLTLAGLSAAGVAMIGVLWAYEGWQYVTFSAGETVDPQRTFPRGIVLGTAILIGVYLLANLGYMAALDREVAMTSESIAFDAVHATLGPWAATGITIVILVAMFSAANGLALTAPRVYFAMARDGVFFRALSRVHVAWGTPAVAIGAGAAWAMVLALSGTFEQLLTYVVFIGWIFYGLGALSLFVHRRRRPHAPRPFRVPGYPLTPLLFVLASAAIVVNTLVVQPIQALLGLTVVALGVPAYRIWRRKGGEG